MSIDTIVLIVVFFSVLIFSAVASEFVFKRREVDARLQGAADGEVNEFQVTDAALADLDDEENQLIRRYFEVTRRDSNSNSTQNRLIRAGYFGPRAVVYFQAIRAVFCLAVLMIVVDLIDRFSPGLGRLAVLLMGAIGAGAAFILVNIYVERLGEAKEREYRRLFPDFMDMIIVCLDAGMSIEAAANRVAKEFTTKQQDFGLHLSIMMLEVRGGRRLRDALTNLATRLRIEEARALAVLFRQSEELGTSVTQTLRIYSREMRQTRVILAEEKANALPIKMLFPLGAFLFPVSLIIVLVPIVMRVGALLTGLTPS